MFVSLCLRNAVPARGWRSYLAVGGFCLAWLLYPSAVALASAPTITGISPNNGPTAGGTSVTIEGSGFITGSTVKFGSNPATGVTIESSTKLKATSPAGSALEGISVTNSNGTSASTPYDQFGYDAPPSPSWLGLNGNSGGHWLGSIGDLQSMTSFMTVAEGHTAPKGKKKKPALSGRQANFQKRVIRLKRRSMQA
jgi:hypothetical protein